MWSAWHPGKYRPPKAREELPIAKRTIATEPPAERAILVGARVKGQSGLWKLDESLNELSLLAGAAGAEVVSTISQSVEKPNHYYVGTGKLEEIKGIMAEDDCAVAIFDDELTPIQQRNLENALDVKIIDRTALILDVFARHARTREGQLQVELAQHQYLLPRLAGQWSHLERLGGGIGTRGPGETQLETDRRLIRRRIQKLEQELELVRRRRVSYMERRKQARLPVVSLVGYTNAGKSTLFNALSDARVVVRDQPFSTLDSVTRRIWLPSGGQVLLTDTVGFIHKLPTTVIASFRATLEELQEADLLLHVVDITHPKAPEQAEVVESTLTDLRLRQKAKLLVVNKMDQVVPRDNGEDRAGVVALTAEPGVLVSAALGWNLAELLQKIESRLSELGVLTAPDRS